MGDLVSKCYHVITNRDGMVVTRAFCAQCMKETDVRIDNRCEVLPVRGEDVEVEAPVAVCSVCGEDVWLDEMEDATLGRAFAEYRRRHSLLQPDDVRRIRGLWGLGQRAFSRLLGWGEITLHRYESGSLQDSAHDAQLRLAERPENVRVLLNANGRRLTTRQRDAVERRLQEAEASATEGRGKSGDRPDDYVVVGVGDGRRPGGIVSVKLDADEMELLVGLAQARGESLPETFRAGLRSLLEAR